MHSSGRAETFELEPREKTSIALKHLMKKEIASYWRISTMKDHAIWDHAIVVTKHSDGPPGPVAATVQSTTIVNLRRSQSRTPRKNKTLLITPT